MCREAPAAEVCREWGMQDGAVGERNGEDCEDCVSRVVKCFTYLPHASSVFPPTMGTGLERADVFQIPVPMPS